MTEHETPELIVRAWQLHQADPTMSSRALGRALGVAPQTARRYVDLGRNAEQWVVAYDRAEMTTIVHEALAEILGDALEDSRKAEDGKERALHRATVNAVAKTAMQLHGLAAPTRHVIDDNRSSDAPDPALVALIRDAAQRGDRAIEMNDDPAHDDDERY